MAKKSQKNNRNNKQPRSLPRLARIELEEAQQLLDENHLVEARAILSDLNTEYPNRTAILESKATVCALCSDMHGLQNAARSLLEISSEYEVNWLLPLAEAYMENCHPALGVESYEKFLRNFPTHENAGMVRKLLVGLKKSVASHIESMGFPKERMWEMASLHERINIALEGGEIQTGELLANELLEECPHFAPALNNLSQAQWLLGRPNDAITTAWKALEFTRDNIHTLSNLTRMCFLTGRVHDAEQWAKRLQESNAEGYAVDYKKAEAFALVGDDKGVLDVYRKAQKLNGPSEITSDLHHLVAVSWLRLGQEDTARELWKEIVQEPPGVHYEQVVGNLAELKKPVHERYAPWPFGFETWINQETLTELNSLLKKAAKAEDIEERAKRKLQEEKVRIAFATYLEAHPNVEQMVKPLLDRGDPSGQQFALMLIGKARTPNLLSTARLYALFTHGSDQMRMSAAQIANEEGVLPSGSTRLWVKGEWRDLLLMSFEVTGEPPQALSAQLNRALQKSLAMLRNEEWSEAEEFLRNAVEKHPGNPSLQNNLCYLLMKQNRLDEVIELTREIHHQHPDYIPARSTLARHHLEIGEIETAQEFLDPIMSSRKIHISDLSAWMSAQIEIFIVAKSYDAADSWLDLWESNNDNFGIEDPGTAEVRRIIRHARNKL